MRNLLAALGAALLLSACGTPGGGLPEFQDGVADSPAIAGQGDGTKTPADPAADRQARLLNLGAFVALVSELAADRVTKRDAADAPVVLAHLQSIEAALATAMALDPDGFWSNTEMFGVRAEIYKAVAASAGKVRLLLRGLSPSNVLDLLSKAGLGRVMAKDIKAMLRAVKAKRLPPHRAWAAILGRIKKNRARIEVIAHGGRSPVRLPETFSGSPREAPEGSARLPAGIEVKPLAPPGSGS